MRKTTLAALVMLGGLLFVFLWVADAGVSQHRTEVAVGQDLTREFGDDLASATRVRLRRERGHEGAAETDPATWLLLLTASPSAARWSEDPKGEAFGRALAERAHGDERYGLERPVPVVEVLLARPDGTRVRLGFREGKDGRLAAFPVAPLPK